MLQPFARREMVSHAAHHSEGVIEVNNNVLRPDGTVYYTLACLQTPPVAHATPKSDCLMTWRFA